MLVELSDFIKGPRDQAAEDILEVHKLLLPGLFIAGGAARWMHPRIEDPQLYPGDIDIFATWGSEPGGMHQVLFDHGYVLHRQLGSTTTFKREGHLDVQVVREDGAGRYGSWRNKELILESFGFRVEKFLLHPSGLLFDLMGFEDARNKQLVINTILDPVRLAWRVSKYAKKGFAVEPALMAELFAEFADASEEAREGWLHRNTIQVRDVFYTVDGRRVERLGPEEDEPSEF